MSGLITSLVAAVSWIAAATALAADSLVLQISDTAPPCSDVAGLPVVPNDPAALTTGRERRCYGTQPAIAELRLPEDRMVWLERSTSHPVVWIAVGTALIDAQAVTSPPIGIRWRASGDGIVLETRYDSHATAAPLEVGAWQQIRTAAQSTLWVRVPEPPGG